MKTCETCLFMRPSNSNFGGLRCFLARGGNEYIPCSLERSCDDDRRCGPSGRYWEPKDDATE
jgi:hypothetical protein